MFRDFHSPGRSPVMACEGMAATSHPLASEIAIATLRAGGTAADAAVAAVAALGVVEPHMTGIGGDCFCLVAKPGVPLWGYNGSGRSAARGAGPMSCAQGMSHDRLRIRACGHGAGRHRCLGRGARGPWPVFGLDRALAPAIHHGERGFPVAPRVAWDWGRLVERLRADPGAARHLPVRWPGAAAEAISCGFRRWRDRSSRSRPGAARVLRGAAADIVATLAARGSWLAREDFAAIAASRRRRSPSNYRGLDVVELPPNGQGLTALRAAQYSRTLRSRFARSGRRRNACTSRSRRPGLPMACAIPMSPIPAICGSRRGPDRQGFCRETSPRGSTAQPRAAAACAVAGRQHRLS